MSGNLEQPPSDPPVHPSSLLSNFPSVVLTPTVSGDSYNSSVPTPSCCYRKDEDNHSLEADFNNDVLANNVNHNLNSDLDDDLNNDLDDDLNDNLNDNLDNEPHNQPLTLPLSQAEKLDIIIEALRRTRWTFEDMIEDWVGLNGPPDVRVQHRQYHKQKQQRSVLMKAMQLLADSGICQEAPVEDRCVSELDRLVSRAPFSNLAVNITFESIDDAQAAMVIQEVAPTWYVLLKRVRG
jgi:hypothetical protein